MRALDAPGRRSASSRAGTIALAVAIALLAACSRPLPDADTPAARAYAAQCGLCHVAYAPGLLTAAMWEVQVARMDEIRRQRAVPPIDGPERKMILDYLRAHAG